MTEKEIVRLFVKAFFYKANIIEYNRIIILRIEKLKLMFVVEPPVRVRSYREENLTNLTSNYIISPRSLSVPPRTALSSCILLLSLLFSHSVRCSGAFHVSFQVQLRSAVSADIMLLTGKFNHVLV